MKRHDVKMFVPEFRYCTDNATMIGAAAYILYRANKFSDLSVNASSHEELDVTDFSKN